MYIFYLKKTWWKVWIFRPIYLCKDLPYIFYFIFSRFLRFFPTRPPPWNTLILRHPVLTHIWRIIEVISTMADNKFRPACHWVDITMWSWHYVQLTQFSIFVILVIVTAIIKIKIGKRSVHQREVLLQISYASASWSVSYEKGEGNAKQLENLQFDKLTHQS
jgi:hypothetical protein